MRKAVFSSLSQQEVKLIERYLPDQRDLGDRLAAEYEVLIETLDVSMVEYLELLERVFAPDPAEAFLGSIELARSVGVPTEEILDSKAKTLSYFMD